MSRPHRRLRWLLLAIAGLATLTGLGWALHQSRTAAMSAAGESGTGASENETVVVCYGYVDLNHGVVALSPSQPGRVTEVLVEENQEVSAGTALLRLDDRLARAKVAEVEAALKVAQEHLAQARKSPTQQRLQLGQQQAALDAVEARLLTAREGLKRKQKLRQSQLIDSTEVTAAEEQVKEFEAVKRAEQGKLDELKLRNPEGEIRRIEAEFLGIQARLDQVRVGLGECELKAPHDGRVLRILVSPGDFLSLASQQPALQFARGGPRLVRAELEQEFVGRVHVGQVARIVDDIKSGPVWRGRVKHLSDWYTQRRSILREPLRLNDVRTVECLITFDPGQPLPRLGQRMRVTIVQPGA